MSWANLLAVTIGLITIILPFLLTFSTNSFWSKFNTYQEHPLVNYNYKLYTSAYFATLDSDGIVISEDAYEYSTVRAIQNNINNQLSAPTIQSASFPNSGDSDKNDRINITMVLRKPDSAMYLSGLDLIIGLDYQTSQTVKMQMESLAIVSY